jgi:hypothetical protein
VLPQRCLYRPTGCSVGVEGSAACLHCAHDVLQVTNAAGEAINAGHHEHVALAEEFEDRAQLLPPRRARAAALLNADHLAPSSFQRGSLDGEVLIDGADGRDGNFGAPALTPSGPIGHNGSAKVDWAATGPRTAQKADMSRKPKRPKGAARGCRRADLTR